MIGLVELAQRYVSLSAELEETRSAMRAALMNGSDRNPTKAGPSGPPNKGTDRERVLAQSKAADERVLALLREKPMRPSEIARATQGKLSTNARAPAKTAQARRSRARGGRLAALRGKPYEAGVALTAEEEAELLAPVAVICPPWLTSIAASTSRDVLLRIQRELFRGKRETMSVARFG